MPDGVAVLQYRLVNNHGLACKVITYGGIITELHVPDRTGGSGDIVLGCDTLEGYLKPTPYFGAIVGRVGNRIARGRFNLDGREYILAVNDGPNHLHGGLQGFDKRVWLSRYLETKTGPALELTYRSPDGEEGYPGNLDVTVVYHLTDRDELRIDYRAVTDRDTPVNLTNHTYWNLAGRGTILGQIMTLRASRYTPVDDTLIPTGAIDPVAGSPMDFTRPKPIGRDLDQLTNKPRGYDHNFVLDPDGKSPAWAAQVYDPPSGRVLEVLTDQPGVQFYTGNFLDGTIRGKAGVIYSQYDALCLETQHFPDAVHHPNFPSIILHPGETYRTGTTYRFSVRRIRFAHEPGRLAPAVFQPGGGLCPLPAELSPGPPCLLLAKKTGLDPTVRVADIGSGTGIFSRLLIEAGATVFAVEPNAAMRAAAEAAFGGQPRFASLEGTAEATGLPERSVSLITCAQAFHWFDPAAARGEFVRILSPDGWCALIWNTPVRDGSAFALGYEKIKTEFGTDFERISTREHTAGALHRFFRAPRLGKAPLRQFPNPGLFRTEGPPSFLLLRAQTRPTRPPPDAGGPGGTLRPLPARGLGSDGLCDRAFPGSIRRDEMKAADPGSKPPRSRARVFDTDLRLAIAAVVAVATGLGLQGRIPTSLRIAAGWDAFAAASSCCSGL